MTNYFKNSAIAAAVMLTITGCSVTDSSTGSSSNHALKMKNQQIEKLTKTIQEKNNKIALLSKASSTSTMTKTDDTSAVENSLVPPNAKAGECYAKVLVPAKYKTEPIERLLKEAQSKIEITPATYKMVEQRVMVKEASIKLIPVDATYKSVTETIMVEPEKTNLVTMPATYKTVTENMMVEPEKTSLVTMPATYKNVSEKVLISPAHTEWKKGRGEIEKIDNSTGDIMCLIEVPAVYKTVTTKVLDKDAYTTEVKTPAVYKTITKNALVTEPTTKEVKVPAVYTTVTKKVLVTPATTKEVVIPAVYKTVKTNVLDTPVKENKISIPAVYDTYNTTVKTSEPYLRWQEILCETNTTPNVISKLQKRLQDQDYKITLIDGIYGPETTAAVNAYQKAKGLNQGALTLKTLESLGL